MKNFHVVTCISNPVRYKSRYTLYKAFEKHVLDAGATLTTVELAFGNRPHAITEASNPMHVQLRTGHELWHKENMLNVGFQHVCRQFPDAKYLAWIDADVSFSRADWLTETIHQLQHYDVVQMFSVAQDLDPHFQPFQTHWGFCYQYCHKNFPDNGTYGKFWHPGYAWAARRSAIDAVGGLLDTAILGAGDHHMALALAGRAKRSIPRKIHPNYAFDVLEWEKRAERHIKRNIGYVDGLLLHYWHGKKKNRRYVERWSVLIDNNYDPRKHIKRDSQGIWQLTDENWGLRDGIRDYFRQRNEDSIDMECDC